MPEEQLGYRPDNDNSIVRDMKFWVRVEFSSGPEISADDVAGALPLCVEMYDDREPENFTVRFSAISKDAGRVYVCDAGYAVAYQLTVDPESRRKIHYISVEDFRFNAIRFGRESASDVTAEFPESCLSEIENIEYKFYINGILILTGSTGKLIFEETDDKGRESSFAVSAIHRFGIDRNFLRPGLRDSVPIDEICRGFEQHLGFNSAPGARRRAVSRVRSGR